MGMPSAPFVRTLQDRLSAIGGVLERSGRGLALLALGSAADTERMDVWSDLDFFAIVKPGHKGDFLHDLWWLREAHPLDWAFQNTADGWKALFADGVFVEFAIFEPHELSTVPFAPGRLVWRAPDFDEGLAVPRATGDRPTAETGWVVGEALSNLFIGLGRFHRGERTAAFRMVQVYAVDRVLDLIDRSVPAAPGVARDNFGLERRAEARHPALAAELAAMMPGVDRTPDAALAILAFLESRFDVTPAMAAAIRRLAKG